MPIHKLFLGHKEFPIHKRGIFYKFKEIKALGGDVREYVAQLMPKIDDEIVKKDRLWMETNYRGLSAEQFRVFSRSAQSPFLPNNFKRRIKLP